MPFPFRPGRISFIFFDGQGDEPLPRTHRERVDFRDRDETGECMVGQSQLVDKLRELARNLWWVWQPNVIALFRELDPALWRKVDHNPVEFLKRLPAEQLERRAAEMALDSRIDYAFRRLAEYLQGHRFLGVGPRLDPAGPAGGLLLGRVRPAREPADLLRAASACWPATISRAPATWAFR